MFLFNRRYMWCTRIEQIYHKNRHGNKENGFYSIFPLFQMTIRHTEIDQWENNENEFDTNYTNNMCLHTIRWTEIFYSCKGIKISIILFFIMMRICSFGKSIMNQICSFGKSSMNQLFVYRSPYKYFIVKIGLLFVIATLKKP